MNLFSNTDSYKDSKGYIVLGELPKFQKVLDKLYDLPNWVPLAKDVPNYPWKDKDYFGNFYYKSFVDVYVNNICKGLSGKWVQISTKEYLPEYKLNDSKSYSDRRYMHLIYILNIEYLNAPYNTDKAIGINYIDINCDRGTLRLKLGNLYSTAFRIMTDNEVKSIENIMQFNFPEPYIERFLIKEEYKKDYNLYLEDAKKYGYDKHIWAKELIDNAPADSQIDKNGSFYGGNSCDVKYINI